MGERVVDPKLNVHERYNKVNIINPYRFLTIPTDNIIAYYPFSGNADDESSNSNDGTVYGATLTTDRHSNSNSAYNFDGVSDYIEAADISAYDSLGSYSISLWARNDIATGVNEVMFGKYETTNWSFYCGTAAGFVRFAMGTGQYTQYILNADDAFTDWDDWNHFVFIKDNDLNEGRIYINNVEIDATASGTWSDNTYNSSAEVLIGRNGLSAITCWDGDIDDIRMYGRVLTESEMTALYNE